MWRPWRAWDRFFFKRFNPHALAILRILLGLLWLAMLGCMAPSWYRFFGAEGLPGVVDPAFEQDPWSVFALFEGVLSIEVWWWLGMIAGVTFTIGLFTRTSTAVLWVLIGSMIHRNLLIVNGEDLVIRVILWWGLFMPLGHALSVDERWRIRRAIARGETPTPRPLPMMWATRMLQLNIVAIYAFSLPLKIVRDTVWRDGTAMYFALINDNWSRLPWPELIYYRPVSMGMSWMALLAEGSFVFLVWPRRTRVPMVLIMTTFHVGIAIVLQNVVFFSLSMVVSYWAFIPAETSRRWLAKVNTIARQLVTRSTQASTVDPTVQVTRD